MQGGEDCLQSPYYYPSLKTKPADNQRVDGCGPVQNRTGIQGFGDPYTIHCTTGPVLFAEDGVRSLKNREQQPNPKGWQNYELFQQSPQVSAEYFDRDSQEDDPKKQKAVFDGLF